MKTEKDSIIRLLISYNNFEILMDKLVCKIKNSGFNINFIYGIPRGGLPIAVHLSHFLKIPLIYNLEPFSSNILIVDDICDSGETMADINTKFQYNNNFKYVSLFIKPRSKFTPDITVEPILNNNWVIFPWEPFDDSINKNYMFNKEV